MALTPVEAKELEELRALKTKVEARKVRNKQKREIRRAIYKKVAPELRAALKAAGFNVRE